MEWTKKIKQQVTERAAEVASMARVNHKILAWGQPMVTPPMYMKIIKVPYIGFTDDNDCFIIMIKYKGYIRYESINVNSKIEGKEFLSNITDELIKVCWKLREFVEFKERSMFPLQPDYDDIHLLKYIMETISVFEIELKSIRDENFQQIFNYTFKIKNTNGRISSLHWYETLYNHLGNFESVMKKDIYDEYIKLKTKYQSISTQDRPDLEFVYAMKEKRMRNNKNK